MVSPGLACKILKEQKAGKAEINGKNELTADQREVLTLVSQGEQYKDIAAKLGISESRVKHHVKRVVDKLHRQKRKQLIDYTVNSNIIDT